MPLLRYASPQRSFLLPALRAECEPSPENLPPPRRVPIKLLYPLLTVLFLLIILAAAYLTMRPKTYDALGELTYKDKDGTYQLLTNTSLDRYEKQTELSTKAGDSDSYRFPLNLYVNHVDTGADAGGIFRQKVESAAVEVVQADGSASPVQATKPQIADNIIPGTTYVSFIDFTRESPPSAQLVWRLHMTNGDTIRLRFNLKIKVLNIYNYDAANADLSTSASLQSLLDRLAKDYPTEDIINIHLPAVTYTEPISIPPRAFNISGSEEDGRRTTFTAGIRMATDDDSIQISYLTDLDFIGNGNGVAVSTANRMWLQRCRFEGWRTGVLVFGTTWANTTDCSFTDNVTGLHYNSTGQRASDTHFTGNTFTDNETAVLLENVPADVQMDFEDCVFTNNKTDINNRDRQPVDISQAVFQ